MGLRSRAWRYRSGLKEKAAYFKRNEENDPGELAFKKSQYLQTLMEISEEIYQTLDPQSLMNILLLTFMGQTRSQKGALLLKEKEFFQIKINKGLDEAIVHSIKWDEIQTAQVQKDSPVRLIFPLQGRQDILGFLVLGQTGISELQEQEEILKPLLSLGGIALENALLYSAAQKKLKQMSALYEIGDTLTRSANLEEILFLAFSTLEYGFKMKKILLLARNDTNEFQVIDGFGCREETHRRFRIPVQSEHFKTLPFKHPENLKDHGHFPWNDLLDEQDYLESNNGLFIPLKVYGEVSGYLVILQTEESDSEPEWNAKLYQLLGTYFAFSFSLMENQKDQNNQLSVRDFLINALQESMDFCRKMGLSLGFYLVSHFDESLMSSWIQERKGKSVRLILGKTLLILPYEKEEEIPAIQNHLQENQIKIDSALTHGEKDLDSILQGLGLN